jgi:hypothetical protein
MYVGVLLICNVAFSNFAVKKRKYAEKDKVFMHMYI